MRGVLVPGWLPGWRLLLGSGGGGLWLPGWRLLLGSGGGLTGPGVWGGCSGGGKDGDGGIVVGGGMRGRWRNLVVGSGR